MNGLRQGRLEAASGRYREAAQARAAESLLRETRQLKTQLAAFGRTARELHRLLDLAVSEDEVEAMRTPAANLLGTLECLIGDDLKAVLKKLGELDGLLERAAVAGV